MVNDDERREVARRLRRAWANVPDKNPVRHHMRVLYEIYAAVGLNDDDADAIDLFDLLADLIEPDTTSDTTKSDEGTTKGPASSDPTRKCSDPTLPLDREGSRPGEYVGVRTGPLHEGESPSEYYCARCGYPVTDHDSYCRECGGAFQRSFSVPSCDRDALLAVADELSEVWCDKRGELSITYGDLQGLARIIREACGATADE